VPSLIYTACSVIASETGKRIASSLAIRLLKRPSFQKKKPQNIRIKSNNEMREGAFCAHSSIKTVKLDFMK
jgi:hypothetical protein